MPMHAFELQQLRYFAAVARTGSFTKAAETEAVAQPTVSQQVAKLEKALGLPLFERLGRGVRLTPAGRHLLAHVQNVFRELREARATLQAMHEQVAGNLAVGVIPTVLPYLFPGRIDRFRIRYPAVRLQWVEEVTERLLERLAAGDLDLAVVCLPIRRPHLVCAEILREPLLVALPPHHKLASAEQLRPEDLRAERLVILRDGHCLRSQVLSVCRRLSTGAQDALETYQLASVAALVASGFGVSLVPAMAAGEVAGCEFRPLRGPAWRRVGYVRRAARYVPPALAAFMAWLKEVGRELSVRLCDRFEPTCNP